jgi:hypothetical protein
MIQGVAMDNILKTYEWSRNYALMISPVQPRRWASNGERSLGEMIDYMGGRNSLLSYFRLG